MKKYKNFSDIFNSQQLFIAGPCAVESEEQIMTIAKLLSENNIKYMRAQLWKPRSNPKSFQGIGLIGLEWLKKVKQQYGLVICTEIVDKDQIEATKEVSDILWVGARNMQNFELLKALSKDERVVILKRGFISTLDEWLASADYIGRDRVIMCERGVRTGVEATRFTLDLGTALVLKKDYNMKVIADPSHPAGRRDLVIPLAKAALSAGLDGIVFEVHPDPDNAKSDAAQQLSPAMFRSFMQDLKY